MGQFQRGGEPKVTEASDLHPFGIHLVLRLVSHAPANTLHSGHCLWRVLKKTRTCISTSVCLSLSLSLALSLSLSL